jgi:cytochrome c oxidase subunit 2
MLFIIVYTFNSKNSVYLSNSGVPLEIVHNPNLEMFWTVIPCIILVVIAIPSFTLLYQMDDISNLGLTVKVIGNQWH